MMASDHVVTVDVEFRSAAGIVVSRPGCKFTKTQTLRSCVEDFFSKAQLRDEPVLRLEDLTFAACGGLPWADGVARLDKSLEQLQFFPDNGFSKPYILQLSVV